MVPVWLHEISIAYLVLGALCAALVALDVARHPQPMGVMNLVWPVTAVFGSVLVLAQYFIYGRPALQDTKNEPRRKTPFPMIVANGTLHCGGGCTLGDISAEWLVFMVPSIAVAFGYHSLFSERIFAVWVVDFLFAFGLGIVFQYFSIVPMRQLSFWPGIFAAVKADTLSLTAWQIGMYGFMAFAYFYLFRGVLGIDLKVNTPEFWFMMQLAMLCGFLTAYPVNWWLIRNGVKVKM